jgi:hypothetical protein
VTDTTKTPRHGFPYLDPSQSQPEVKINEVWDIIDANLPGGSDVESDSSAAGGSITVEDLTDSPATIIHGVTTLRVEGATLEEGSGGVAILTIKSAAEFVLSAGWNSSSGAVPPGMTIPQDIEIPSDCTLQEVRIQVRGGTGSCTVTLGTSAFPVVTPVDITDGVPPAISSGTSYSNSTLTGWTKTFTRGAMITAALTANSVFTSVKIFLRFQ